MARAPKWTDFPRYPVITITLALSIGVTLAWWAKVDISPLFETAEIRRGQLWRLVTSIFPHLDILHLAFPGCECRSRCGCSSGRACRRCYRAAPARNCCRGHSAFPLIRIVGSYAWTAYCKCLGKSGSRGSLLGIHSSCGEPQPRGPSMAPRRRRVSAQERRILVQPWCLLRSAGKYCSRHGRVPESASTRSE